MRTFNIGFWEPFVRSQFIRTVELFVEAVEKRLLPAFDSVNDEAELVRRKIWEKTNSSAGEDADFAALAERADEAGVDYYQRMVGVKQGLLNIVATALYHLFEQQTMLILRREVLPLGKENDAKLFKVSVFQERLRQEGIDITQFSSWNKLMELRLVSNSVKHAEGNSAEELRKTNPRIFINPILDNFGPPLDGANRWLYAPLSGDDLYVRLDDLKNYSGAVIKFWNEYISALSSLI